MDGEERKTGISLITAAIDIVNKHDKVCIVTTAEIIDGDEGLQTYCATV